jgi:hypothetical protein
MFALIYDEFDPANRKKEVVSVHRTRAAAETALTKRQQQLGKRVWECKTRIVWVYGQIHSGDSITPDDFGTWAPDEKIPAGDRVPDVD